MNEIQPFYSEEAAAKLLNISRRMLKEQRLAGLISYKRVAGKVMYRENDLMEMQVKPYTVMPSTGRPGQGARLVKLPNSRYYIRWFQDGRTRELSTKTSDFEIATKFFNEWLAKIPPRLSQIQIRDARLREPVKRSAVIYFIQAGSNGPIKIGIAINVENRLRQLQSGHYEKLTLLGTLIGTRILERQLLNRFKSINILGEWHKPASELLEFISNEVNTIS